MPLLYRKTVKLGPLRLNIGRKGLSSWSFHFGRWSWNSRTRRQRFDLPGPFSWISR